MSTPALLLLILAIIFLFGGFGAHFNGWGGPAYGGYLGGGGIGLGTILIIILIIMLVG